tara:strand:+ start:1819 stop:1974 length:156 start_codon:yes stop_codon:yes gene_type:complete
MPDTRKKQKLSKNFEKQRKERQNRITYAIKKAIKDNQNFWKPFNKALKKEK